MPPWMIEEIERLKEKVDREDNRIPLYVPIPIEKPKEDKDNSNPSGVHIISL